MNWVNLGDAVTQEHALGCAVACVASSLGVPYARALELFEEPARAWTTGYYCEDVIAALTRGGRHGYRFDAFDPESHSTLLLRDGTIVFVSPGPAYPAGHYLLRTRGRWMNPWINFPGIVPAQAGFEDSLPSPVAWIVHGP